MVSIQKNTEPADKSTVFIKELSRRLLEISRSGGGGQFNLLLRQKGRDEHVCWIVVLSGFPDFRVDLSPYELSSLLNKLDQTK
jgi:hypothetical protein